MPERDLRGLGSLVTASDPSHDRMFILIDPVVKTHLSSSIRKDTES
jgi:hypothetical protein